MTDHIKISWDHLIRVIGKDRFLHLYYYGFIADVDCRDPLSRNIHLYVDGSYYIKHTNVSLNASGTEHIL